MPWRERTRAFASSVFLLLLGYLALVVVIDAITPRSFRLDVYAAVAPMVAAALCTFRQTLIIALLDFLTVAVTHGVLPGDLLPVNRVSAVLGNALMVGASIVVAVLLRDRDELLLRVSATGEAAQRALLRPLPLSTGSVVVDGFYVSSQRDALVGGDIYEVVATPYGTRVLIGDVQGKGLRTLGAGAAVLTAFREAAYHRRDLCDAVDAMEQGLLRHNAADADNPDGAEGRFVTALVFGLETAEGPRDARGAVRLVCVDCGHLAPYLIRSDGTVTELEPGEPGLPLGLSELADAKRTAQPFDVPADSRIFACTDGVTEARRPGGPFFPLAERLAHWADLPTPELLRRLRADLAAHTGGRLEDDAAALVMEGPDQAAARSDAAGPGTSRGDGPNPR